MRVTELLSLAFKKLALDVSGTGQDKGRVWLTQDPEILHPVFEKLAEKYGADLPALQNLSFTREGAFSYSSELTDALGMLQLTGAISRLNPTFDRFSPIVYEGSDELVRAQVRKIFGDNEAAVTTFNGFVKDLEELVVEPSHSVAR